MIFYFMSTLTGVVCSYVCVCVCVCVRERERARAPDCLIVERESEREPNCLIDEFLRRSKQVFKTEFRGGPDPGRAG